MNKYEIAVREEYITYFTVDAESEAEARKIWENGDAFDCERGHSCVKAEIESISKIKQKSQGSFDKILSNLYCV